jgi:hypothetical protein
VDPAPGEPPDAGPGGLPTPPGGRIRAGFLTGLACAPGSEGALEPLLAEAARRARGRGLDTLLHGAVVGERRAPRIGSAGRVRRYRSVLYLVAREDPGAVLATLRRGPRMVESVFL